jgi:hypothetical protein
MSNETIWPAYAQEQQTPPPRRRRGSGLADLVWVLCYFAVAGVLAGLVWWQVVTPAYFVRTSDNAVMLQAELAQRVQADGWFVVIGFVAALLGGVLLTAWRARSPMLVMLAGYAASLGAGILALEVGTRLGHHDVAALARTAKVGAHVPDSLGVISHLVVIAWPIGFLVSSLVILWGTSPRSRDVEGVPKQA